MNRRLIAVLVAVVLVAGAIVGGVLVPRPAPRVAALTLASAQTLACPVGDATLGKTAVSLTDSKNFTASEIGNPAGTPSAAQAFATPAKPVVARGSSMLGGVSTYTEGALTTAVACAVPMTYGVWSGVDLKALQATVVLTNVDTTPASVDVLLYNAAGPVTVPGLTDITVPAGQTQSLSLNGVAASDTAVAVAVRASRGRVLGILAVRDSRGLEWEAPQTTPGTTVVIPVVPAGDGARTLAITNTTQQSALVNVSILGDTGAYPPLGLEAGVTVPAASSVTVDLTAAFAAQASAVALTSTQAVTASLVASGGNIAVVSGTAPLGGPLSFPATGGTLWFANTSANAVTVTVQTDDNSTQHSQDVQIPASSIASIDAPASGRVVLTSGQASAVWVDLAVTAGGASIVPLVSGGLITAANRPPLAPGLG